ncbi:MAG: aminotransferase class I/II-fold pyridoxal phosphate-dependent enzyme [Candidatus Paceibacteria bacterium]
MKKPMFRPTERMNVVSYPIRDIVMEAKKEEGRGTKMFWLNIGDPPQYGFKVFEPIVKTVKKVLDKPELKGYAPSEGDFELRMNAAKIEGCKPEDIFVVGGLTEGIDFLFHSFIGFGEKVLLPNPTYSLYISKCKSFEGEMVFYRHDEDGQIDLEYLEKKMPGAKVMVIINPNNPLGSVYREENLKGVVELCAKYDVPIFYDGSYDQIVFDAKMPNFRKIASEKIPFIYGNSLSKNFSYPGSRVGWVAFHGGDRWNNVKDAFFRLCNQRLSVNWEYQKAAAVAITDPSYAVYIAEMKKKLLERRNALIKATRELPLSFPVPRGAFYCFMKIETKKWKRDTEFVRAAIKKGVVFVPGSGFGKQEDGVYFRTTFLPEPTEIEEAFERIGKIL